MLVVDDEPSIRETLNVYLNHVGIRDVRTAHDGKTALDLLVQEHYDYVFMDLMMPDRDGWDLLQTLVNHPETGHIPIIVCTVLKQKAMALSLGAAAFLEKPVTERELLAALRALEEE